jgi:hypothetical protein
MDRQAPAREPESEERIERRMSRRSFLRASALIAGGMALAACGGGSVTGEMSVAQAIRPVEQPILPSPMPVQPTSAPGSELEQFLALSALLTGFDDLSPEVARVYLASLTRSEEFAISPAELYQQAGLGGANPPTSLDELAAKGLWDDPEAQPLADKIIEMWYTGVYTNENGEQQVATYADNLTWRSLTYTKPLTICGSPGFWAQSPQQPFA